MLSLSWWSRILPLSVEQKYTSGGWLCPFLGREKEQYHGCGPPQVAGIILQYKTFFQSCVTADHRQNLYKRLIDRYAKLTLRWIKMDKINTIHIQLWNFYRNNPIGFDFCLLHSVIILLPKLLVVSNSLQ